MSISKSYAGQLFPRQDVAIPKGQLFLQKNSAKQAITSPINPLTNQPTGGVATYPQLVSMPEPSFFPEAPADPTQTTNVQTPDQTPEPPSEETDEATDTLEKYGQPDADQVNTMKNPRGNIQFLAIIGQIEGHNELPAGTKTTKYEHVIPQLVVAAENLEVDGILILLNTAGGDVEAGLAIAELISGLGKPTVSLVLGGGHSIGVPLAVSSSYSFIAPSATMIIHPVRMTGTMIGAPQTYDYLQKMQDRITSFVAKNSAITKERFTQLMMETGKLSMDVGTMLQGEEAVAEKLIDATGGLHDAMEKLYELISQKNEPNRLS